MTKLEKLERLKNRRTYYELAADGKYLAGYCLHGKKNILDMLRKNGEAWAKRITEGDLNDFDALDAFDAFPIISTTLRFLKGLT